MDMSLALGQHPSQINLAQTVIQVGEVGNPAPASFSDLVSVLPQDAPQNPLGPMPFLATRGTTLPAVGDTVLVVYDENRTPYCLPVSTPYGSAGVINVASLGAKLDGVTDDTTQVQRAISLLPAAGGTILIPGPCRVSSELVLDGKRSVILEGIGGITAGAAPASYLSFAQSGSSPCISAANSYGVIIRDLAVFNVNSGYTGDLISFAGGSDSAFMRMDNMLVEAASGSSARLLNLNNSTVGTFRNVYFSRGNTAVLGVAGSARGSANFSNGHTFIGCKFTGSTLAPVVSPGEGWTMLGTVAEPVSGGGAGFLNIAASGWAGIAVLGGWLGDANTSNPWIYVGATGGGLTVQGAEFGDGSAAVLINVGISGVNITGNKFDFCTYGVNFQAATYNDVVCMGNDDSTCTTAGVHTTGSTFNRSIITDGKAGTGNMYGITVH